MRAEPDVVKINDMLSGVLSSLEGIAGPNGPLASMAPGAVWEKPGVLSQRARDILPALPNNEAAKSGQGGSGLRIRCLL